MDSSQWPQGIGVGGGGVIRPHHHSSSASSTRVLEKKPRPSKEHALNCPRCTSTNTKFCYYNNYSLSQPRYFCKNCRRYWTEGGSLRNVPVGGGSRKNKRSSFSSSAKKIASPDVDFRNQNPKIHHGHDLNLAYNPPPPPFNGISDFHHVSFPFGGSFEAKNLNPKNPISSSSTAPSHLHDLGVSFTIDSSNGSSLGFSLDGISNQNMYGGDVQIQQRAFFPFEEMKGNEFGGDNKVQDDGNGGYWSGMLAGGSW